MKKLVILFILLLLPAVSATTITLHTEKFHEADIYVLDASAVYQNLQSFLNKETGTTGVVTVDASLGVSQVDLLVHVKTYEGVKVHNKRFENIDATSAIEIYLPESLKEVVAAQVASQAAATELPSVNESNSTEESVPAVLPKESEGIQVSEGTSSGITGNVIDDSNLGFKTVYIYYILGALLLAGILFFVFRNKGSGYPHNQFKPASKHDAHYVMHLEKKLKSAESEINHLKNQGKIKEIERRMEEERKEIERLRHGF